ncbi:hypothetical protein E3N88_15550 [Mikania micrantha]|uniref:Uncharacterized protein n=1 Tax=Mikania micrantha TaxID=192012 RepID=A0A5N6NVQ9_9ASTR|nr:hypothetical protein E3N88_15550 [Mikania micrantha]
METTNGKNFLELRRGKGQNHFTNKKTSRAWVIGGITTGEAAKILANLIVMGSGILIRGMVQAYRQALQNASKSGVAQETIQNVVRRGSKVMTEQEARQILGVTEQSSWEEIAQASTILILSIFLPENNWKASTSFTPSPSCGLEMDLDQTSVELI